MLLITIRAVLSQRIFGIAIGRQSLPEAERTMYELVRAVNSMTTPAITTHAPVRKLFPGRAPIR
jgi:hypothetical protein